jgi:hypothetical protein
MKITDFISPLYCFASPLDKNPAPGSSAPRFRREKALLGAAACMLFSVLNLIAQGQQIFKGRVCVEGGVPTTLAANGQAYTAQCNVIRAKRGAHYLLSDPENKTVYLLDGHKSPRIFAGQRVFVVGSLDKVTATIHVEDILRALPLAVSQAKSVYIDCDACPRGMAAAWLAAFEGLTDWGRFDIVPDPKRADLVFLLSANPYLGDYITRDGPDKRPVRVDITYMDVVDPHTGESLWDDSRRWGSFFVARATKDLIVEFKEELEVEESATKGRFSPLPEYLKRRSSGEAGAEED